MNSVERHKLHLILKDIINTLNGIQVKYHLELEQANKKIDVIMYILRHIVRSEEVDRLIAQAKQELNEPNLGESFRTTLDVDIQALEKWVNDVMKLERMIESQEEQHTDGHTRSDEASIPESDDDTFA